MSGRKYNIFQGSKLLQKVVASSLGYELKDNCNWRLTDRIYFEAYFYLSKRFGKPKISLG